EYRAAQMVGHALAAGEESGRVRERAAAGAGAAEADRADRVGAVAGGDVLDDGRALARLADRDRRVAGQGRLGRTHGDGDVEGVEAGRVHERARVAGADRVRAAAARRRVEDRAAALVCPAR